MTKDVLQYNEQELLALSDQELEALLVIAENNESLYNTRQLVEKTLINSLYGAMANKWFPLFNELMAAAITGNGRFFIQKLAINIEDTLQKLLPQDKKYIVYGDTDSVYYQIEPFVERYIQQNPGLPIGDYVTWADNFEKKVIQPCIERTIAEFAAQLNAYNKDKIGAEREIIADAAVFTAKKKYYARVRDSEGTRYPDDAPKVKVMGLEIIKSSTPPWSKKYLKEAIPHILDKDENDLRNWIKSIKNEFIKVNLNQIAGVGGVSRLDYKIGDKGIPFGSRAAIMHNMYIKKHNLEDQYAPIQAGDKCKRISLQTPNVFDTEIIAYTNDSFVKEIQKHNCVDYDTQFEKYFMKPLDLMVAPLNYDLEKETEELDDW
jgi:hypothetical protein